MILKDRIILQGMEFYGYHGVLSVEREQGQPFIVDVEIITDFTEAARTDNVEDTVDYAFIFNKVRCLVEGSPVNLLETLAISVAREILEDPLVEWVRVRVTKPQAPSDEGCFKAAVEVERENENR